MGPIFSQSFSKVVLLRIDAQWHDNAQHACMCGGAHDPLLGRELLNILHNMSMTWTPLGCCLTII